MEKSRVVLTMRLRKRWCDGTPRLIAMFEFVSFSAPFNLGCSNKFRFRNFNIIDVELLKETAKKISKKNILEECLGTRRG